MTIQQLRYVTAVAGADTIEQLAEYIGVEPAALSATVEQYNKVCAEGYDSDFAKDPHFLNSCKGSLLRPCHHPESGLCTGDHRRLCDHQ